MKITRRLFEASIADKELSALLAGERLVPVVHQTTYEALREVSPMLASRSGLSTAKKGDSTNTKPATRQGQSRENTSIFSMLIRCVFGSHPTASRLGHYSQRLRLLQIKHVDRS
jgi:hypothetical protein